MIPRVKGFHVFTKASCSSRKKVTEHFAIMGGTSGSNLVEETLSVDKPFAFFTDVCF